MSYVENYTFLFKLEINSNKKVIKHKSASITFPLNSFQFVLRSKKYDLKPVISFFPAGPNFCTKK